MAKHPAAFINTIAESGTKEEAIRHLQETWDSYQELREPLRRADAKDWDHLIAMIPDSGHGKFWKEVFAELRQALQR